MQYRLPRYSLKNIYKLIGGLFALLLFPLILNANGINFVYIYPQDLIINIHPDSPLGKAYIFWEPPTSGKYTLNYNYKVEKTALKNISCNQNEEIKFYISSNSVTTATGEKAVLDLPDGTYTFDLKVTSSTGNETYSRKFTITVDGTPPHTPTGLKAIPGNKGVELKWNSPVDTDIEAYFAYFSSYPNVLEQIKQKSKNVITTRIPGNVNNYYIDGLKNNVEYHFILRAMDHAENYSDYSKEVTATPRETYSLADLSGEEGGCFIATATYGNINNPIVIIFRMFRDNILAHFKIGRKLINKYYQLSPHYVPYLYHYPLLRVLSLLLLAILSLIILIPVLISLNPFIALPSFLVLLVVLFSGGAKN